MVQTKKIALYVVVVFVLYTIITSPEKAADLVQIGFEGISSAAQGVGVRHGRVDGEVVGDRPLGDVPGALPELQLGDDSVQFLEGLHAGSHARLVACDAVVELEEDQMADHGHS